MNNQMVSEAVDAVQHAYFETPNEVQECVQALTRSVAAILSRQDPSELIFLTAALGPLIQAADASPFAYQAERWRALSEVAEIFCSHPQQMEVDRLLEPDTMSGDLIRAISRNPGQSEAEIYAEPEQPVTYAADAIPWSTDADGNTDEYSYSYTGVIGPWPAMQSVPGEMVVAIGGEPGLYPGALAKRLEKSKSHISNELNKLERAGLIRRLQKGKTRRLYLTDSGRRYLRTLTDKARKIVKESMLAPSYPQLPDGLVSFDWPSAVGVDSSEPRIGRIHAKHWFAVQHHAGANMVVGVGQVYTPESLAQRNLARANQFAQRMRRGITFDTDAEGVSAVFIKNKSGFGQVIRKLQASKRVAVEADAFPSPMEPR